MPKKTIFAEQRRNEILEFIQNKGMATVDELCKIYSVSNATIRADLCALDSKSLIQRTHGGAISLNNSSYELTSSEKEDQFLDSKVAIGNKALEFIKDGDCILLDTGTTILQLAKQLKGFKNLTVFVYDLKIALVLEEIGIDNIVFLGGNIRNNFHCTYGTKLINEINNYHFDKCFIATNGVSINRGLSTANLNVANIKSAIIKNSSKVIALFDSSKINHEATISFSSLKDIDIIITDKHIKNSDYTKIKKIVNKVFKA